MLTGKELWADFCHDRNIDIDTPYEAWAFCGGGKAGDELAKQLLAKAADYLSSFGFPEINVACLVDNEGSRKTILANGGKYIETVCLEEDGVYLERYSIKL